MRVFVELIAALGLVSIPGFIVWGRHQNKTSRWYADTRGKGDREEIIICCDLIPNKMFIHIDTVYPESDTYDQDFSDAWARAVSAAEAKNAAIIRRNEQRH